MAFVGKPRSFVLMRCGMYGDLYAFCPDEFKNDREIALQACRSNGEALDYAKNFQDDKEIVIAACSNRGRFLRAASAALRGDKDVVLAACSNDHRAMGYASDELKMDREFIMELCSRGIYECLDCCQESFIWDREVILAACRSNGAALQCAHNSLRDDKEFVLEACKADGKSFRYISERLRRDKEVALAAVASAPEVLKYALEGINQDKDCLIAAGIWDYDHDVSKAPGGKLIVLSTRFSLAEESSPHATKFAVELKRHPYIRDGPFTVYSPNAFSKETCDPEWTRPQWVCRGTFSSCQMADELKKGYPRDSCCWRYSFRYHLARAKTTGGCMIQVVDHAENVYSRGFEARANYWEENTSYEKLLYANHSLGQGQKIETEMAEGEGTKIFRFFEPDPKYCKDYSSEVNECVKAISDWYGFNCQNMSPQDIGENVTFARVSTNRERSLSPVREL